MKPNLAGKKRKKRAKKKKETIGEETDEEGEGAPGMILFFRREAALKVLNL